MASAGEISVRLTALTAEYRQRMREAAGDTSNLRDTLKTLGGVAGVSFAGMSALIAQTSKAFGESARAGKELALAFKATGQMADIPALKDFATNLQKTTNFEDDATIGSMGLLASFKLNEDQIKLLTPRIQDVAEFMGVDLNQAARMVGTSVTTGTNALQRMGVAMNDAQQAAFGAATQSQRVAMMADLMRQKLGGAAQELASPFKQLGNAVGDLQEEVGGLFYDTLKGGASALRDVIGGVTESIASLSPEAKETAGNLTLFATGAAGVTAAAAGLGVALPSLVEGFSRMAPVLAFMGAAAAAVVGVVGALGAAKIAWDGNLGGMRDTLTSWADSIKETFSKVGDFLNQYVVRPFIYASAYLAGQTRAMADETWKTYQSSNAGVDTSGLGTAASAVGDIVRNVVDALKQSMGAGVDVLGGLFKPLAGGLTGLLPRMSPAVAGAGDAGGAVDWGIRSEADRIVRGVRQGVDEFTLRVAEDMDGVSDRFSRVKVIADDVFTDAQMAILDSGGTMVDDVTGAVNGLGRVFNWLADTVGPNVASTIADALGKVAGAFTGDASAPGRRRPGEPPPPPVSTIVGTTVLGAVEQQGLAGSLVQSGIKGVASGGPFGAIAVVLADLFTHSKGFAQVLSLASSGLQQIADLLGSFAKQLVPVSNVTNMVVGFLSEQLTPVLDALNTVIGGAFFYALKYLTLSIAYVIKGLGEAWNGMVRGIAAVFDKLGDIELFGVGLGFMHGWADSIRKGLINMNGLDDAIAKLNATTLDQASATQDATDAQVAQADAMEQLLNVPAGYKLALARFEAAQGNSFGGSSAVPTTTTPLVDNSTVIENITVVATDPEDAYRKIRRCAERDNIIRTGGQNVGPRYVIP